MAWHRPPQYTVVNIVFVVSAMSVRKADRVLISTNLFEANNSFVLKLEFFLLKFA